MFQIIFEPVIFSKIQLENRKKMYLRVAFCCIIILVLNVAINH